MTRAETAALRALISAAKGSRQTLGAVGAKPPPGESRIRRDIRRLDIAIGEAEAVLQVARERSMSVHREHSI